MNNFELVLIQECLDQYLDEYEKGLINIIHDMAFYQFINISDPKKVRIVNQNGNYHNIYGPALVSKESKQVEFWEFDGRPHRFKDPAIKRRYVEEWWEWGVRHREDGPAVRMFIEDDDGELKVSTELWYIKGHLDRIDGPAFKGAGMIERWYRKDILHRDLGAAVRDKYGLLYYYHNGIADMESNREFICPVLSEKLPWLFEDGSQRWLESGKVHNTNGPAIIHKDGTIEFYERGHHLLTITA